MKEFLATARAVSLGIIGGAVVAVAMWVTMAVLYKYVLHGLMDWATR